MRSEDFRTAAKVNEGIQNAPGDAVDEFRMVAGRPLEMHSSQNAFAGNRVVAFAEVMLQSQFTKGLCVERLDKLTTIVVMAPRTYQIASRDASRYHFLKDIHSTGSADNGYGHTLFSCVSFGERINDMPRDVLRQSQDGASRRLVNYNAQSCANELKHRASRIDKLTILPI